ncbi:MAG: GTPase [Lachnospiraceae bacterium]|nr:GTPase [Lachnospiraceae bacterium]
MFGNRDIPVYLFTGFLESGKTTCIKEILEEGNFEDGLKTLFLITEEGEKEIDENLLKYNKVIPVIIDEEEDLTEEKCISLVKEHKPARIMIEVNGMWNLEKLINKTIPENWVIVQTFTTVNAETFSMYINNMKSLIMAHFQQSDLVIFNRCTKDMDKASMRRNVKGINRMAQVLFESEDGSVESNIEEELPFDVTAKEIILEDDDFGLWYLDVSEHPEKYEEKMIIFKGQVYRNSTFPADAFVPARAAMTCCADDIAKIGFICHYGDAGKLATDDWVTVRVKVKPEFSRKHQSLYPVLWADKVEPAEPPAEEVVYFS